MRWKNLVKTKAKPTWCLVRAAGWSSDAVNGKQKKRFETNLENLNKFYEDTHKYSAIFNHNFSKFIYLWMEIGNWKSSLLLQLFLLFFCKWNWVKIAQKLTLWSQLLLWNKQTKLGRILKFFKLNWVKIQSFWNIESNCILISLKDSNLFL